MTIDEVIAGLKQGRSFRHEKTEDGGAIVIQRLDPASDTSAFHSVSVFNPKDENGNSGGSAEISTDLDSMGRQDPDGWIEIA
jgi:bifunctional DNA-binding transcriptional regulator/antitoxin component of YhaV-PrlF toxin-antitoxin module